MAKVRKGFVSNSSSSSFIVAFPKGFEPTTQSVTDLLFGGNAGTQWFYDNGADHAVMARVIVGDMQKQNPNDSKAIGAEVEHMHVSYEGFRKGTSYDWDAYQAACDAAAEKEAVRVQEQWADKDIYVFEYSDGNGSLGCCMEHGGTFDAVEHIRISKH